MQKQKLKCWDPESLQANREAIPDLEVMKLATVTHLELALGKFWDLDHGDQGQDLLLDRTWNISRERKRGMLGSHFPLVTEHLLSPWGLPATQLTDIPIQIAPVTILFL